MKIYDCFIFNDELDLLEIRFNLLKDVVDCFVLFETDSTFSGKPKVKHFIDNVSRFQPFLHKISYVSYPKLQTGYVWANEWASRNLLIQGLKDAVTSDIIMYSDVDEIPNPEVLKTFRAGFLGDGELFCLEQVYHYYGINLVCENHPNWPGTMLGRFAHLKVPKQPSEFTQKDFGFQEWREKRNYVTKLSNAGWHYSYCVGLDGIKQKVRAFSHAADLDIPEINNDIYILNSIKNLESLNPRGPKGDGIKLKRINIDETNTPKWLLDNHKQYPNLIW
jgi:hypothetical protein